MIDRAAIHVWKIPLMQLADVQHSLGKMLTADEMDRANRFVFAIHRERFVVARGALRTILGNYLDSEPAAIRFQYSTHGKPAMDGSASASRICFNLSHSEDVALLAVTMERELGVDIEVLRTIPDADRMATRYFDPLENATYQRLPAAQKAEGFLVRWTLKEAYIKARGQGLSIPLDAFNISTVPDGSGFHCVQSTDAREDARWAARRLDAPAGYIAALVAEGRDWTVSYRQWPADLRT